MATEQLFSFLNLIVAVLAFLLVAWGLLQVARAIVLMHEHHRYLERAESYEAWLAIFEDKEKFDKLSDNEQWEYRRHLAQIAQGRNGDLRGPWEQYK